jgi:Cu+-exporting ATPase
MNKTVKDPVCGMEIEPMSAAAQTTYKGHTYYFCSQECKDNFDKNPQKYIEQVGQPEHHH